MAKRTFVVLISIKTLKMTFKTLEKAKEKVNTDTNNRIMKKQLSKQF